MFLETMVREMNGFESGRSSHWTILKMDCRLAGKSESDWSLDGKMDDQRLRRVVNG